MVAGLLFARAGLRTIVLEKHADFLRDFRGDTVHPSILRVFAELGLLNALLARPHQKLRHVGARIAGQQLTLVDFTHLPVPAPFIALIPQWEFLDFIVAAAERYPGFELRRNCQGVEPIEAGGRVVGVRTTDGAAIGARLVLACDGRDSRFRAGLPLTTVGAPMDIFWFRLPKSEAPDSASMGVFDRGRIFVLIDRGDYWQCAFVLAKGAAEQIRAEGIAAFRERVRAVGPETAGVATALPDWDAVKLLSVTVDRLERWHRPGLLVIGDAAHAMSPLGGIGINLAVQDAVAAANVLAGPMAAGADPDPLLERVERRRKGPTRITQEVQRLVQDRVIAPLLAGGAPMTHPPLPALLLDHLPLLRRLPARLIGLGARPEHVRSPEA
jgi:2-polyprenyl-6-methoxyphenol hydroxylase-like FAD-dependent oxidoreductase